MSIHSLSLTALVAVYNSVPGVKPIKKFASKGQAFGRVEAALQAAGLTVDASGAVVQATVGGAFEKATKEALGAMDGAARAAYRTARRAAARAARKAKRAAA